MALLRRSEMSDTIAMRRVRVVLVVCQGRLRGVLSCGKRLGKGLKCRFSGDFGRRIGHGHPYREVYADNAIGWPVASDGNSLIATVILGRREIPAPKLLRKMVTSKSLAARNLTAASRSANVRAQTLPALVVF